MPLPLLVSALFAKGLDLLGNAVLAKGQDVIEKELGISLSAPKTPEEVASLRTLEIQHEQFLTTAALENKRVDAAVESAAAGNVTERWKADMASDSWLSKNIRPSALIYLTGAFTVFILLDGFIETFNPDAAYITLLAELLKMVYAAYFVGRSVEKGIELVQVYKTNRKEAP